MSRTLYLFSNGTLKRKDNTLCVITEDKKHYLPVNNINDILIFGEIQLNKRTLEFLTQNHIPVHFFNRHGFYIGTYYPREFLNSGFVILKQAEHYIDNIKRLVLASQFVKGALTNMLKVIHYYLNRTAIAQLHEIGSKIEDYYSKIETCSSPEELMALEGNAREQYYKTFDYIINNPNFSFEKRTRRPPQNRLNALISFGNSLLYTICLSEIYKTHLDPRIGFLHTTNFRRFSLNLDIAEIFKPIIVDRIIFSLVNKKMLKANHFMESINGLVLTDKGKRIFLSALEERLNTTIHHRKLGRNVSYRTLIRMEAYKVEKHLLGEETYQPFVSRW
ncbi:MAG: type I-B CRISPR-associated endonuclease Cas1 [Chlorobi bacterium]|nr:type I-B CRISPR-associated endonuclease Cas1 [Chlorobiota bacterium]